MPTETGKGGCIYAGKGFKEDHAGIHDTGCRHGICRTRPYGTTLWKTRDYERVQGQILGVDDSYIRRDSGDSTVVHKIYFSYRVGESEYSDFYEDLTRWGAKAGKKITVHYDPAAPERNRKPMTTEIVVFLGVAVLTLAFAAMTRKAE